MATARWFFADEPASRFVIQEHLRQGYWTVGPAALWIDVQQAELPYRATGYWHDVTFELEWMPRDYLLLRASRAEPELVRATSLQLGFKPGRQGEENGQSVWEWRIHPLASETMPDATLDSQPA
jgi:hypothetical protein